jgi:hypothetical protein
MEYDIIFTTDETSKGFITDKIWKVFNNGWNMELFYNG